MRSARAVVLGAAGAAFAAGAWTALDPGHAGLSLLLVACALIVAAAAWLETGPTRLPKGSLGSKPGDGGSAAVASSASAKELALIATLAAAAAAGRVLFAAIPGVQPVTVIVVVAGAALGARAGIAVGATAALVSNFFLGQGPWTPWQMLAWGACGAAGAFAAPLIRGRLSLAIFCCLLGFGFSAFMDVWNWLTFFPHTWQALAATWARGLWFDAAHGAGNFVIALAVGPELRRMLERYARRLHTEVVWA
jgi:energy-coupling factor transport system substrate-specific component